MKWYSNKEGVSIADAETRLLEYWLSIPDSSSKWRLTREVGNSPENVKEQMRIELLARSMGWK